MQRATQTGIRVEKPCHISWEKMEPAEQGRFCKSCNQIVTDFTQMSTPELIAYFERNKGQVGCGKFRDDQLSNRSSNQSFFQLRFRHILGLLLLPLLTFFSSELKAGTYTKTKDQGFAPGPTTSHYYSKLLPRKKKKKKKHIKGRTIGTPSF